MLLLLFLFLLVCVCCVFGVLVRQYCSCSLLFVRVLCFPLIVEIIKKHEIKENRNQNHDIRVLCVSLCLENTSRTRNKPQTKNQSYNTDHEQTTEHQQQGQ